MKFNTCCASPYIYRDIILPNTLDLANSNKNIDFLSRYEATYRRETYGNHNSLALMITLGHLYGVDTSQVCLFNSGQAVVSALSFSGLHNRILYDEHLYPETRRVIGLFAKSSKQLEDLDEIRPGDLFVIESISIPQLKKRDLKKISDSVHSKGGEILVDNSVLTSYWCNPFEFGVDYVLDSLSKQCSGHNNAMLGALLAKDSLKNNMERLGDVKRLMGNAPHAIDIYNTQLGLQTLHVRAEYIARSTLKIAEYFSNTSAKITYSPHAGMIFIFFDSTDPIKYISKNLPVFMNGCTFGNAYSLYDGHYKNGTVLRLSIGLEDPEDLIDALRCVESVWQ